jgi:O-antigen ligase
VVGLAAVASFAGRGEKVRDEDERIERRNRNLLIVGAAAGLIVVVLGSVLLLGGQESLLRGMGLQYSQDDVYSGRLHFWSIAWQIFLQHPILGAGMNGFGVAFSQFDTWKGMYRVENAHNDYLQILADGGILGFACVAVFLFLLFRRGIANLRDNSDGLRRSIVVGALAGCTGILIHSAFDFPLRTPANALMFLLLITLAVSNSFSSRKQRSL